MQKFTSDFPRNSDKMEHKKRNETNPKCGTARVKMLIQKLITNSLQIIFGLIFVQQRLLFLQYVHMLDIFPQNDPNMG